MTEEYVLFNNHLVAGDRAHLSVWDRGLLYGDGFFETLRVEQGQVLFLKAHLERLYQSCRSFNLELEPQKDGYWAEGIKRLIWKNHLQEGTAAVKIIVTRGPDAPGLGLPRAVKPTIIVYARQYDPLPRDKYTRGLGVEVFPYPRHSFLADHKSLNYLFYLSARDWAQGKGADEALVLNGDGMVSEGATSNIFYVRKGSICRPESAHYLRGIMEGQIMVFLREEGEEVLTLPTSVTGLAEAEEVLLTNSLLGVIPVARIGENVLPAEKPLSRRLQGVNWMQRSHGGRDS